jgi:hypothetical protein
MLYRGQFKDIEDNTITLYIQTERSSAQIVDLNSDDSGIRLLASQPVYIEQDVENTFECIFMKSAEINLLTKHYLGDNLFTGNSRDVIVNVWKSNECIFAGFLTPNIYTQPYDHVWDSLTLHATDALATLKYFNYMDLTEKDAYDEYKKSYGEITFARMISLSLRRIPTLNLQTGQINSIYYDGSVRLDSGSQPDIFSQVKISELLWLGDSYDDISTEEDMFNDVLKYFDLKLRQEGTNFYIYSMQSIYSKRTIEWYPIALPEFYIRKDDSYIWTGTEARECLYSPSTGSTRPGNLLTLSLSNRTESTVQNGSTVFARFYYALLPNNRLARTPKYETTTLTGKNILTDGTEYKVVNGNVVEGSYDDFDNLPDLGFVPADTPYTYSPERIQFKPETSQEQDAKPNIISDLPQWLTS